MPEFNLPTGAQPAIPPAANRPLTGPAPTNAPALPSFAPQPTDQYQPAPQAPAPRDPQLQATFNIYALGLHAPTPIEVSQALQVLENLGPAFRQDAINAAKSALLPGGNPMKNMVLIDSLQRWGAKDALPQLEQMMRDGDASVKAAASKAYMELAGVQTSRPVAPANAPPGTAPAANAAGPLPQALVQTYVDRLKDHFEQGNAAVEVANMPTAQIAQITMALAASPDGPHDDRAFDMLTKVLGGRVREPGAVDALRAVLNKPNQPKSKVMAHAMGRAAIATLHFGTPADQAGYLKLMVNNLYVPVELSKLMVNQLAQRPDLLAQRASVVSLAALMNDNSSSLTGVAAAVALSKSTNPLAKDAIGDSTFLTQSRQPYDKAAVIDMLLKMGGPYSAKTVDNVRIAQQQGGDKPLMDKIAEFLRKVGR